MSFPDLSVKLPTPSAEDAARSETLVCTIREAIAAGGGAIDFSRFMDLALYAPNLGYYASGAPTFDAGGDFITAPEVSPVFGRCVARQCAEILHTMDAGSILEAGAGSGVLCVEILRTLESLEALPARYLILELSGVLRARQQARVHEALPHLAARVQWLSAPPQDFRGIVLANELLDALPVERFRVTATGIRQLQVSVNDSSFVWSERAADEAVRARVAPLSLPHGYVSEVGLAAEAWVRTLGEAIREGVMLIIDYGFPRAELYHPQRERGTLMCHYRHRAHDDPFFLPGLQDITAHIDFTGTAEAGVSVGLEVLGYSAQAGFLLANGIEYDQPTDEHARRAWADQVRMLTLPHEMGELFKVIALGRGTTAALRGFSLQDRRGRL